MIYNIGDRVEFSWRDGNDTLIEGVWVLTAPFEWYDEDGENEFGEWEFWIKDVRFFSDTDPEEYDTFNLTADEIVGKIIN